MWVWYVMLVLRMEVMLSRMVGACVVVVVWDMTVVGVVLVVVVLVLIWVGVVPVWMVVSVLSVLVLVSRVMLMFVMIDGIVVSVLMVV